MLFTLGWRGKLRGLTYSRPEDKDLPRKRRCSEACTEIVFAFHTRLTLRNSTRWIWKTESWLHGKNGFVTATKLGTSNNFFVAATKNFAAATKRFVDRTKHFVVVTKYFCYPYLKKNDFVGITKPFLPCWRQPSEAVVKRGATHAI